MSLVRAVQSVEITRLQQRHDRLQSREQRFANEALVKAGTLAVNSGVITEANVGEKVRDVVARQVTLIEMAGFAEKPSQIVSTGGDHSMTVWSRKIELGNGLFAELVQRGATSKRIGTLGWVTYARARGLETAIEDFASASTTAIRTYGLDENGSRVYAADSELAPYSADSLGNASFRERWRNPLASWSVRDRFASEIDRNHYADLAGRRRNDSPLTPDELIAAAGCVMRFKAELDVFQWAMDNIPQEPTYYSGRSM